MTSSHPPTLITLARRALREAGVGRGASILCGVSGGPDSMALLDVLAALRRPAGLEVLAHGVDHGLRAGASAELDLARDFAATLQVPFARTALRVAPGGNLQARAREARHAALREAAAKHRASFIALAHHADDRAETVLLRLLRGAGPRGLAVLPPRAGPLVRPLIRARKLDVLAHLARHRVPFAQDPSNEDARFLRVRVRKEVLPLLESLSPTVVLHLCALADQLGEARDPDAPAYPLPRATLDALARLAASSSPRGRVLLPGGLVATAQTTQVGSKRLRRP